MKKDVKVLKKFEILIKIVLAFSCQILTLILSNRYEWSHALVGSILSFIIMGIILYKTSIKSINKNIFIISTFISCYMMRFLLDFTKARIETITEHIKEIININYIYFYIYNFVYAILGILALPALIFLVYLFIDKIIKKVIVFLKQLSIVEKRYLLIMICIGIILSSIITNITTAFSKPMINGNVAIYNIIYTTDSGALTRDDAFFNVSCLENDIRQPLFGIFALPFAVISKFLSQFIFWVPANYGYETVLTIIQFILTTITTIMIGRLLKLEEKDKKYLYLLFGFSFPYLLFNLVVEQYAISLFYLILTIYLYKYESVNYAYVGATGTMITSGVLFPLITKFKNIKQYIKDIFKCFIAFVAVFVIGGQYPQILLFKDRVNTLLKNFTGEVTFYEKICQFLNFVKSIFLSAKGEIINNTYQLSVIEGLSVIGIIILVITVISLIINRKEKMAKISFFWMLFSVLILLIIGWGTFENGLVLYSLYFAWAYLVLYFLLIKKIFKNRKIFVSVMITTTLIMAAFNICEFFKILIFAVKYY